jgi:hypothetical protein
MSEILTQNVDPPQSEIVTSVTEPVTGSVDPHQCEVLMQMTQPCLSVPPASRIIASAPVSYQNGFNKPVVKMPSLTKPAPPTAPCVTSVTIWYIIEIIDYMLQTQKKKKKKFGKAGNCK